MCGIASYIGHKNAYPLILEMLKRLEYRGYDSAGIALCSQGKMKIYKEQGAIAALVESLSKQKPEGNLGIGHTRWATHGPATKTNAHPHYSQNRRISIVHNGTVLNYYKLKEGLEKAGYEFYGETDTEILANYLDYWQQKNKGKLLSAIINAVPLLEGRSAFVAHDHQEPDSIYACNLGGELFVGRSQENEYFICSDKNALAGYADEYLALENGQIAVIQKDINCRLLNSSSAEELPCSWEKLKASAETLEKGSYPHFMLKEIFEQENVVAKTIDSLINDNGQALNLSLNNWRQKIAKMRKLVIIACGTSWHAGLVAKHFFAELAKLPVYCEYASEFLPESIDAEDIIIAISQSGSTADTLQAVQAAKERGAGVISICNVDGSALTRTADVSLLTIAGPEIGVASTKAFTTQLAVLYILAVRFGRWRNQLKATEEKKIWQEIKMIPGKIKKILLSGPEIEKLAKKYKDYSNFLFLGRGQNFPIALEGALKLKEVSYIHAEGLSAGEMKHGSIALIDEQMPSFFIAVKDGQYDKVINNLLEISARQGHIIAVTTDKDQIIIDRADDIIPIPECPPLLYPFLTVIPTQLFAYYVARERGTNIDKPRNLAKAVTVE